MSDTLRVMPGTTYRNGMPASGGYVWRGTRDAEAAPTEIVRRTRQRLRAQRRADGRCPDCGYLPGTHSHEIICGGAP
jgi:hypothetical protein